MYADRPISAAQRPALLALVLLTSVVIADARHAVDDGALCWDFSEDTLKIHPPGVTWKRDYECSEFKCTAEGKITKSTCYTEPRSPYCALSPNHVSKPFPLCCPDILCPMRFLMDPTAGHHHHHDQHDWSETPKDAWRHSQDGGHQWRGLSGIRDDKDKGGEEQNHRGLALPKPSAVNHVQHADPEPVLLQPFALVQGLGLLAKPTTLAPPALASPPVPVEDGGEDGGAGYQSVDATDATPEGLLGPLGPEPEPEGAGGDAGDSSVPTAAYSDDTPIMMVPLKTINE